jgi:transcriptional regulator with XRE-family HTH domain
MNIPTLDLRRTREDAEITQSALASKLGVSPSLISRLERATDSDESMAKRYLRAVGTSTAELVEKFYALPWTHTDRPSYFHPNKDAMLQAETALAQLFGLTQTAQYDDLLQRPVEEVRRSLIDGYKYLTDLQHSAAFIGAVGVGKTTALSLLTNLTIVDRNGHRKPAFPASGGRTTLCEVTVKVGPTFAITADALSDHAVRQLVRDMVGSLVRGQGGLSSELDRAVRNMADLAKATDEGAPDPITALLADNDEDEALTVEYIVDRMKLSGRRDNQLMLPPDAEVEIGLKWIADNFRRINYGLHDKFSIPANITTFVPYQAMRRSKYDLSIIDTKGMLGNSSRSDLQDLSDNDRTIAFICSRFNDAPSADTIRFLKTLQLAGSDAFESKRAILLVLPRADEATQVVDTSGEEVVSAEKGQAVRKSQILDTLVSEGIPVMPIRFFNAVVDDPKAAWLYVEECISVLRNHQVERLNRAIGRTAKLVSDPDATKIIEARVEVKEELARICTKYDPLKQRMRPSYQHVIDQARYDHASSIAAAVNRRGEWFNFSIDHLLGLGLRIDANLRSEEPINRIDARLEGLAQQYEALPDISPMIEDIRDNLSSWRQDFLANAQVIGRSSFKSRLEEADDLWTRLYRNWGQGTGYRDRVANELREWFESVEQTTDIAERNDDLLQEAWSTLVIDQLRSVLDQEPD